MTYTAISLRVAACSVQNTAYWTLHVIVWQIMTGDICLTSPLLRI